MRQVDTFASFLAWQQTKAELSPAAQFAAYEHGWLPTWPALHALVAGYLTEFGADDRLQLVDRIWTRLGEWRRAMARASRVLPEATERARAAIEAALGFAEEPVIVSWVGLGCAGWAARYEGEPAVLVGLDGLVVHGWDELGPLTRMIVHELGHLAHFGGRREAGLPEGGGALWRLYVEGLAMVCEHRAMGPSPTHHEVAQPGWTAWCARHRSELAAELLATLDDPQTMRRFFGEWHPVEGWGNTGYALGEAVVETWLAESDLRTVALLPAEQVEAKARATLERFRRPGRR